MTVIQYLQSSKSEDFILDLINDNIELYCGINTNQKINEFSGTLYNYFVTECIMNNQYLELSKNEYSRILSIYIELVQKLRGIANGSRSKTQVRTIVKEHRTKLIELLSEKAEKIDVIVPCAEYTNGFQQKILRLDSDSLMQPVLDIGCGRKASLIKDLRKKGIKAFGFDQYISKEAYILCDNWLEYKFEPNSWGTIISHMSFTNHYRRCITYKSKDQSKYETKFFEILESLKKGGSFIYCPSLPEVEKYVDKEKFEVKHFMNNDNVQMDTVYIQAART